MYMIRVLIAMNASLLAVPRLGEALQFVRSMTTTGLKSVSELVLQSKCKEIELAAVVLRDTRVYDARGDR